MTAIESFIWCDETSDTFNDASSTDHFATEVVLANIFTKIDAPQGAVALAKGASRSRAVLVDRSVLDSMTHLPREKAAQMLGLCSTTFKKVCRRAGLQGWPYKRRHLLCTKQEGGSSCSCSACCSRRNGMGETSPIQDTPFSPMRSTFSASHATASQPITMPLRAIHEGCVSSPVLSAADFSMATSNNLWPSAEQSCNVVDAVMDYLDTLSPGGSPTGMEAVHRSELEAIVECVAVEC
ncbi:hypothetical protein T484DRAFT_1850295 [Baffinella frigidus]|nr:hypothetical protein T484DRAFT_1850295 [Cryptophyta sp. CCMP2293]